MAFESSCIASYTAASAGRAVGAYSLTACYLQRTTAGPGIMGVLLVGAGHVDRLGGWLVAVVANTFVVGGSCDSMAERFCVFVFLFVWRKLYRVCM